MFDQRRGYLYAVTAHLLWGAFPLYFVLLEPAGAAEIVSYRVCGTLVIMSVMVLAFSRRAQLLAVLTSRRSNLLLTLAAVLIAINWGAYIWGVNNHRLLEASLGYFINPLVTVLMGVLFLGERLHLWQWVAIGIATTAVAVVTVDYGQPPWVALTLACSFGGYGFVKKRAAVDSIESVTYETLILTPVAIGYLVWLAVDGSGHLVGHGAGHMVLLASTGVITAVPLLSFGAAAVRVPLTRLGLLQYLTPMLQFILGVAVLGEQMSSMRWAGFGLVWLALTVFTMDSLRSRRGIPGPEGGA